MRLTERRRITSTIEGLDRITVGWSTERTAEYDSAFGVELLDGGDLVPDLERIKDGTWVGMVHLPAPLASGQSHDFCTRVTQTGRMEPYYIVTPFRRTERFEVRVDLRRRADADPSVAHRRRTRTFRRRRPIARCSRSMPTAS